MHDVYVTQAVLPPFEEYINEIKDIWDTHWLSNMGEKHNLLEQELCNRLGVPNISLFTNGHMALELVIQAFGLTGEVITTPFTFASTTHAIVRNGLEPVFCDIDPNDYTIDVSQIEDLITDKTSAIIPVHVYGNICDVDAIEEIASRHGLRVIYDAAHAFCVEYKGIGVGNFGDASMFSFHATKVFNSIEGGAIAYKDDSIGEKLYMLKNFGIRSEEEVDAVGANAKMNEFCAAMGLCNLRHIDEELSKRKIITDLYNERLSGIDGIVTPSVNKDIKPNYAYYPIRIEEDKTGIHRNDLYDRLAQKGVHSRKYFYPLISDYGCYMNKYDSDTTPVAKRTSQQIMTLPMYGDLEIDTVEEICGIIAESCKR